MHQSVPCECRRWTWREVALQTGVAAHERHCPRCRRRMLIVFRGADLVGVLPIPSDEEFAMAKVLRSIGLKNAEVAGLLTVAREMAS